jgi:3-dehydroquinate dehydratase/shikimate dehydrogenase
MMNICVSIAPVSMAEAVRKLSSAGRKADLVEVRTDGMADVDLARLLRRSRPKVIITNRRASEGGTFSGTADEQFDFFSRAISNGADFIDVEMSWGGERISSLSKNPSRTKIIVSYHNFDETPDKLEEVYADMRKTGADILKIATTANDITDNRRVFALLRRAKRDRQKMIAFCMGERGQASRILSARFGGFLTYATLAVDECTAPGQFTVDDLKNIYRMTAFSSRTKVFGLVGNPVSQSKGIFYHNTIFKRKDVNAIYLNFLVDDLASFLDAFSGELHGFSVTMPFKERIIPFLETIDGAAEKLRAVNTVIVSKRRLSGSNTDLSAIIQIMMKKIQPRGKRIIVLGTGGTARTLAFASASLGAHTTVVGRSPDKARAMAAEFGCEWRLFDFLESLEADVLMNGTSVGMHPETDPPLVPKKFFHRGMIVFDAVYRPEMTPLLTAAKSAHCRVITGMELFTLQARLQSKLFLEGLE